MANGAYRSWRMRRELERDALAKGVDYRAPRFTDADFRFHIQAREHRDTLDRLHAWRVTHVFPDGSRRSWFLHGPLEEVEQRARCLVLIEPAPAVTNPLMFV